MTDAPKSPLAAPMPWDLVAAGYASDVDLIMRPVSLEALRRATEKAPESFTRDSSIVDVACGPGTLTLELARRFGPIEALDFSPKMLAELRASLDDEGLTNVRATWGDGMALPYGDDRFDAAFSMFGLMFFPDRVQGFRELRRVLREGGIAVVSSWASLDLSPAMELMFGALRAASPEMPPPMKNLESLENPELFEKEMRAAGFEDVSIEAYQQHVAIASPDEYFDLLTRSAAPCVLMRKRVGEEEWERRSVIARAYLEKAFASAMKRPYTTAYLGFGRKR